MSGTSSAKGPERKRFPVDVKATLALSHMKTLKGLWGITVRLEDALHMIMVQWPLMEIRIRQSLSGPTAPSSKGKTGDVEPLARNRARGRES